MPDPTAPELLDFERAHFTDRPGPKSEAVRQQFGIPLPQYLQRLSNACRSREGIEADPVTAHRVLDRIQAGVDRRNYRVGRTQRPAHLTASAASPQERKQQ